jgi:hypothetical protein
MCCLSVAELFLWVCCLARSILLMYDILALRPETSSSSAVYLFICY